MGKIVRIKHDIYYNDQKISRDIGEIDSDELGMPEKVLNEVAATGALEILGDAKKLNEASAKAKAELKAAKKAKAEAEAITDGDVA
jgi:hypothetical protein